MDQKGKNWEKFLAKAVSKSWMATAGTHMSGWNTGNNWILYINENVTNTDKFAQSKKDLETAKNLQYLGFIFNTDK